MNDSPQTSADDPLDRLSERVRAAQETAERLVREATEAAQGSGGQEGSGRGGAGHRPPPRGYADPGAARDREHTTEVQALVALLELARTVVPPELRRQLAELVRELLLLVRAVIDWYLERIDARRRRPAEVEDIPIS
jgi:hypothetical protein